MKLTPEDPTQRRRPRRTVGRTARRLAARDEPRRFAPPPDDDVERAALLAVLAIRGPRIVRKNGDRPTTAFVRAADQYLRRHEGFCFQFAQRRNARHVPLDDMVQACRIGAMIALERFDKDKAGRFLSYARWWMRCETGKLLHHTESLVPVPAAVKKERELLAASAPADLTDEEAAEATGLAVDAVRVARRIHLGNEHRSIDERARPQRRAYDEMRSEREARIAELKTHARLDEALASLAPVQRLLLFEEFGVGEPVLGVTPPRTETGRRSLRHAAMRRLKLALAEPVDEDDEEDAA